MVFIFEVKNMKKTFQANGGMFSKKKFVHAVNDVSFDIYPGETFSLVGESGCGKSTLGRTLIRLLDPTEGTVEVMGHDITKLNDKELIPYRREVQMVFQDPFTSLNPRKRVGDILMEVLDIHKIGKNKEERMELAMNMLHKVGLRPEHFYRFPHEFSGGQRQRIGIARALILDPKLIVCDEPVSALDVSIQAQIVNLMQDLREEEGISYLFIAHDISIVRYISDRIGVMYLGHLMEEAETNELFSNPLHPYTQALLSAVPHANPHISKERIQLKGELPSPIDPPSGCVFHTRCPYATELCSRKVPKMQEITPRHRAACLLHEKESEEE
ncbi:MAG: dipeptide ABC transporter ATP-binding protein [Clostridiales bacterium]|nr:dipeptide ABC transporter ATP-binding protein [Clostridiales bacterium]